MIQNSNGIVIKDKTFHDINEELKNYYEEIMREIEKSMIHDVEIQKNIDVAVENYNDVSWSSDEFPDIDIEDPTLLEPICFLELKEVCVRVFRIIY